MRTDATDRAGVGTSVLGEAGSAGAGGGTASLRRVALLTEIVAPYRIEPLNRLAETGDLDLHVLFLAETEDRRQWRIPFEEVRFRYSILPGWYLRRPGSDDPFFLNPRVLRWLRGERPQVLVCGGWHQPTYWLTALYARARKVPLLLWSESTERDFRSGNPLNALVRRTMVKAADRYVVPGRAQKEYLESLGASGEDIGFAPNAVRNSDFRGGRAGEVRRRLGIGRDPSEPVLLYVGRMIEQKGVVDLLEALSEIAPARSFRLIAVGDGHRLEEYRQRSRGLGLGDRVDFVGFRPRSELSDYYAAADLFVFPSRSDPWGLVLNEAMAAGLPVVCSDAPGAVEELVVDGENGLVYPAGDVKALARALEDLLEDPSLRARMGRRSSEIIGDFTPATMAEGLAKTIRVAFRDPR